MQGQVIERLVTASQSLQSVCDGRPRRSLRSGVQQRRRSASQAWNLNFNGAKEFHTKGAAGRPTVPWKSAR
jgi:hypothetical protein